MYRIIQSPASLTADTRTTRPGLVATTPLQPVLCCPGVLTAVGSLLTSAAVQAAVNAAENDPCSEGECTEAASDFATSALYVPPGRLSAGGHRVADNASVDELISAARGDLVPA